MFSKSIYNLNLIHAAQIFFKKEDILLLGSILDIKLTIICDMLACNSESANEDLCCWILFLGLKLKLFLHYSVHQCALSIKK